ncbi:MAG: hypothetical protein QW557_03610 [Candidatus Nitrosocaldus sp.]
MHMGSRIVAVVVLILVLTVMVSQTLLASAQTSNSKKSGGTNNNDGKDKTATTATVATTPTTFRLKLSTMPDKLVRGEDAHLIIQMQDNKGNPVQLMPEITSISVLDADAISISDSIEKIGNVYAVKIRPLKSIETKITVVARGLGTMLETIDAKVYEPLNKPSRLALSIKPSDLSYIGPREGYIAVQLLNAKDEPVYADKDYLIELHSSNTDLLQVNSSNIIIKQGTNYAYIPFSIKDAVLLSDPYITIAARHGNMYAEGMIRVEGTDRQVLRLYVMDVVPAVRGQEVYAFVQLQDPNGNAIYAEQDMRVEVKPDSMLIIGGTGTIRKGESMTVISLYVNTDKRCDEILQDKDKNRACVGIIATSSNNLTSNHAMVELVEPVYIDGSKYIGESKEMSVTPRFFPDTMPIIMDGRSKVIGAVQLVTIDVASSKKGGSSSSSSSENKSIRPVIVPLDTPIDIVSGNRLAVEDTRITIARGKSATLINAKVGYDASETRVYTISDYVDDASFRLSLQGHKGITIAGEPLLSKVSKGMDVLYIVYFKDSNGYPSYAPDDMSLRIVSDDKIEVLKGNSIAKGHANAIVQLRAVKEGDSILRVEAVGSTVRYTSTGSISISGAGNLNVNINMLDPISSNSKALASLEVVDADGYPVHARSDVRALLFSSGLRIPEMLVIPKGKYFTLFTVEASNPSNHGSSTEITAMVDGFGIIKRDVRIISSNPPTLKLSAPESIKPMDQFDVMLDASYAGVQLSNIQVSWSSDLAVLTNMYDSSTNEQGKAMARFIAYREGVITITVKISGYGIEESTSIKISSIGSENNSIKSEIEGNDSKSDRNIAYGNVNDDADTTTDVTNIFGELPMDAEYLLMLPAVGGIMTWYVSKKLRKKV